MNDKKCELHDEQLNHIRTTFEQYKLDTENYKKNTNQKLNEILEKLKPPFKPGEVVGFLITLVIAFSSMMIYVTTIKSDARNNTTELKNVNNEIENLKGTEVLRRLEYQTIMNKLNEIDKKVDINEAKQQNKK